MSKTLYEGMFLLTQPAAGDLGEAVNHVKGLLDRADADVIGLYKWDDRKLAYTMKGQRRGTFLLGYFHAEGDKITSLDRDCNLSEQVLRALVLRTDHLGDEEIEQFRKDVEASLDPKVLGGEVIMVTEKAEPSKAADKAEAGDAKSGDKAADAGDSGKSDEAAKAAPAGGDAVADDASGKDGAGDATAAGEAVSEAGAAGEAVSEEAGDSGGSDEAAEAAPASGESAETEAPAESAEEAKTQA